jgi:hypothetical protein
MVATPNHSHIHLFPDMDNPFNTHVAQQGTKYRESRYQKTLICQERGGWGLRLSCC